MPDFSLRRPMLGASLVAGAVVALLVLDFFAVRPLQERGLLDSPAVLLNVVASVVAFPGKMVGRYVYSSWSLQTFSALTAYYLTATAVSALFYWAVAFALLRRRQARFPRFPDERRQRRQLLRQALTLAAAGGAGALGGYAVLVEPRWPRLVRRTFPLRGLPPGLDGLKVLHLTDLHLGRFNSAAYLRSVVRRCNDLAPDLALVTGDHVHGSPRFFEPVARVLAGLRCRHGVLAVLGNHDHWEDPELGRRMLIRHGTRLVENTPLMLTSDGLGPAGPGPGLCLSGVGDLWEGRKDLDAAFAGVPDEVPRLLLSHNPDFAESSQAKQGRHRVDLMLAGHTHGGQVRLPSTRGLIIPSAFGTKYAHGLVQGPAFPVFVSTGVGVTILPVRLLVRPQIVLLTLRAV